MIVTEQSNWKSPQADPRQRTSGVFPNVDFGTVKCSDLCTVLCNDDDNDELGTMARFAFTLIATALFSLMYFFTFTAFTVFHFECKQCHGENLDQGIF